MWNSKCIFLWLYVHVLSCYWEETERCCHHVEMCCHNLERCCHHVERCCLHVEKCYHNLERCCHHVEWCCLHVERCYHNLERCCHHVERCWLPQFRMVLPGRVDASIQSKGKSLWLVNWLNCFFCLISSLCINILFINPDLYGHW